MTYPAFQVWRADRPTASQSWVDESAAEEQDLIPAIAADGTLRPVGKLAAHQRGILHQAISVFIFAGDEMLLQQRAADKYHCGSLWANSCCTHPHWGEGETQAANRRLREELGVSLALRPTSRLTYAAQVTQGLVEHERVQVYRGDVDKAALRLTLNPAEVQDVRWLSLDRLRDGVAKDPGHYAPWLKIYLARWSELGF